MKIAFSSTATAFVLMLITLPAFAGTTTGMPYETPLQTLTASLTGPVAFGFSLAAVVGAGATLLWGDDFSAFARKSLMVTLVIAILVFAAQTLSVLFGVSGALV